jgi:hypothetical protein
VIGVITDPWMLTGSLLPGSSCSKNFSGTHFRSNVMALFSRYTLFFDRGWRLESEGSLDVNRFVDTWWFNGYFASFGAFWGLFWLLVACLALC